MRLHSFNITNFRVDGGAMFGVVPKLIWSRYIQADEDNLIPLALRSLVVETDGRVILIDNGIGDKQGTKFNKHLYRFGGQGLIGGLKDGGYSPEQITDVILTHLHFDHCGGSLEHDENGEPYAVFPNAKYWVSRDQWNTAMSPNPREADAFLPENLLPLKNLGLINFIENEGSFLPGVELRIVNGHTAGQLIPIIRLGEKTLIFGADLFPTKAHVPIKYNMAYDLDITTTIDEKARFLEEFSQTECAILFEHDVHCELGILEQTEKGPRVTQCSNLKDWLS